MNPLQYFDGNLTRVQEQSLRASYEETLELLTDINYPKPEFDEYVGSLLALIAGTNGDPYPFTEDQIITMLRTPLQEIPQEMMEALAEEPLYSKYPGYHIAATTLHVIARDENSELSASRVSLLMKENLEELINLYHQIEDEGWEAIDAYFLFHLLIHGIIEQ